MGFSLWELLFWLWPWTLTPGLKMLRHLPLTILNLCMSYESSMLKTTKVIVSEPRCRWTDNPDSIGHPPSGGALNIARPPFEVRHYHFAYLFFVTRTLLFWLCNLWPIFDKHKNIFGNGTLARVHDIRGLFHSWHKTKVLTSFNSQVVSK